MLCIEVIAHPAIPGSTPLADIVAVLYLRAGLRESELDVSELTDGVRGDALAREVSVRGSPRHMSSNPRRHTAGRVKDY